VVVNRIFLDLRIARWGKWRPSAAAKRGGPVAVLFEQLTARHGLSFDDACTRLERAHGPIDREALAALAGRLPVRVRWRPVWLADVDDIPYAGEDPAARYATGQRADAAERFTAILALALTALSPDDQRLVRRRFFDRASMTTVARERSLEPKALYRHLVRVLRQLRRLLEAHGVSQLDVRELLL
jgi:DNA-directed RNA polymerase specialized sigma24 family protein